MSDNKEFFDSIYEQTKNLGIAANCIFVLDGKRTSFLLEKHLIETNKENVKTTIKKYLKLNEAKYEIFVTKKDSIINFEKLETCQEIGEVLSYPCVGENLDFENRKYVYTIIIKYKNVDVYEVRWNPSNTIMAVICKNENDEIFKKITENFQKSIDNIDRNLEITYIKEKVGNMGKIIKKLENKKKLKDYEKETVLSYFMQHELMLISDCYYNRNINIFKKKKFLLTMIYYLKYHTLHNKYSDKEWLNKTNDVLLFQKNVIKVNLGIDYSNKEINELIPYFGKEFEFELKDHDLFF